MTTFVGTPPRTSRLSPSETMDKSPLYTRTGDDGTTALVSGNRLPKDHTRIEAYGTIDELNSAIGLLAARQLPADELLRPMLLRIQNRLFDLGAYLATDPDALRPGAFAPAPPSQSDIEQLESDIDTIDSQLPTMRSFVLPGGTPAAAQAHVARTIARRAERRIIALTRRASVAPAAICYVNRLSDLLFAIARFCNVASGNDEIFWQKNCQ